MVNRNGRSASAAPALRLGGRLCFVAERAQALIVVPIVTAAFGLGHDVVSDGGGGDAAGGGASPAQRLLDQHPRAHQVVCSSIAARLAAATAGGLPCLG